MSERNYPEMNADKRRWKSARFVLSAWIRVHRRTIAFLLDILREIGDENAYRRHLSAHRRQHSGAEWRRFSEERMAAKYARAKCC